MSRSPRPEWRNSAIARARTTSDAHDDARCTVVSHVSAAPDRAWTAACRAS